MLKSDKDSLYADDGLIIFNALAGSFLFLCMDGCLNAENVLSERQNQELSVGVGFIGSGCCSTFKTKSPSKNTV